MAAALGPALAQGADWLTDGGSPQRTAWQKDEHILSVDNVKNLQILWKVKLDNQSNQMHSLFPPLIVDQLRTPGGVKQVAIVAGVSDNVYGIDVETGTVLWKRHFDYPPPANIRPNNDDPLCPEGLLATPTIGPPNAAGQSPVYALAGDGELHTVNMADGEELAHPCRDSPQRQGLCAQHVEQRDLFTTTSQGCHGNRNQMWAIGSTTPRTR